MTYTFWHSGILIGESDLEEAADNRRQVGGVFRPTAYGIELFPRLTGILSAGHALKTYLEANGLSPDTMDRCEIEHLLDTTPAGQKIIDIGRTLSDVEVRAPDGRRMEFASIGFIDQEELRRVIREMQLSEARQLVDPLPDAPRYIVSATLRDNTPSSHREAGAGRFRRRHWSADN